jgi:hypothetical protein
MFDFQVHPSSLRQRIETSTLPQQPTFPRQTVQQSNLLKPGGPPTPSPSHHSSPSYPAHSGSCWHWVLRHVFLSAGSWPPNSAHRSVPLVLGRLILGSGPVSTSSFGSGSRSAHPGSCRHCWHILGPVGTSLVLSAHPWSCRHILSWRALSPIGSGSGSGHPGSALGSCRRWVLPCQLWVLSALVPLLSALGPGPVISGRLILVLTGGPAKK